MSKRIRTFIAIELSLPVRRRLVKLQEKFFDMAQGIRWVRRENLHLTLKFLGDVDEREVYAVCKTAQQVASEHGLIDMTVAGVGAFPNAARPRVVWAGVTEGTTELVGLRDDLDELLGAEGYPREDRQYQPHITLGRFRRSGGNLQQVILKQASWKAGQMTAKELVVMASQLTSQGPEYSVLGRGQLESDSVL